ncbi:MAG: aspartyl-phosphate phosphatase Spo0E family protein [Paenibacillaceae bacterium]|nr:aspartyl-phosphate phosphatase Spo0E family protein [Paenibacillaceae bacterium]
MIRRLEEERRKLNELGRKSLERGIPLFKNEAVQAQSRKVDELIVQLHRKKSSRQNQQR